MLSCENIHVENVSTLTLLISRSTRQIDRWVVASNDAIWRLSNQVIVGVEYRDPDRRRSTSRYPPTHTVTNFNCNYFTCKQRNDNVKHATAIMIT